MAVSVNWATKVITVPQSDLTLISSPDKYSYNVNTLRLALKDLEDDIEGMWALDTHSHNTEAVLSGLVYARTFEIINGYTITFENGAYSVTLFGANHNILDVNNENSVSVLANNSAGLIREGTGLDAAQDIRLALIEKILRNRVHTDPDTGVQTIYDDDNVTPFVTAPLYEDVAGATPYDGTAGANRRDRLE